MIPQSVRLKISDIKLGTRLVKSPALLKEIQESIAKKGQLVPVWVTKGKGDMKYKLKDGMYRILALKNLRYPYVLAYIQED